ncbi:MAG: SAM hydroxide adenosyltransferase, partial [Ktedonobacteraceae bacterium]
RRRFFAQGEEDSQPFIFADSSGFVGIAVRNGSAARVLGVRMGTSAILTLADNEAI